MPDRLAHEPSQTLPTVCALMTPDKVLPLYWMSWQRGDRVVCRLVRADDAALRQALFDVLCSRQAYPCLLKDPLAQQWYHFDAYVVECRWDPGFEVTLVPTGPIRVSDASEYAPLRLRQKRSDAGRARPRKGKAVQT